MGKLIGIDLGTTNTVVAACEAVEPKVLLDKNNNPQFRSVVGLKKRKGKKKDADTSQSQPEIVLGPTAVSNMKMASKDTIISVKRLMGRSIDDPEVAKINESFSCQIVEPSEGTRDSLRVVMGGKEYSPQEISAMILKHAKEYAEFRLNEEVSHAVVTVPAYFSECQKAVTKEAGELAGLKVIKILDEPTAAAVAFGIDNAEETEPKTILVYDFGGGTFDISILMWGGNVFAPMNLEGDMWLGGDNFDQIIMDYVIDQVQDEYNIEIDPQDEENRSFMVELKQAATAAKETLSSSESADIIVAGVLKDEDGDIIDVDVEITRNDFENMVSHLVEKSSSLVKKSLDDADMEVDQIDHVLVAGNTTCMPMIQKSLEDFFGRDKLIRDIHPKQCVAMGAAIVAARTGSKVICQAHPDPDNPEQECGHVNKSDATICEKCGAQLISKKGDSESKGQKQEDDLQIGSIAPYPYGVQIQGDVFRVFIEKGDQSPTPKEGQITQTYYTDHPDQRIVRIPVFGGEKLKRASDNEKQGEAICRLPKGLPMGTGVRVCVWLNSDGIFELSAHLEDGTDLKPHILRGKSSQQLIDRMYEVETKMDDLADDVQKKEAAEVRNVVYDNLAEGNEVGAKKSLNQLNQVCNSATSEDNAEAVRNEAENIIGFCEFILRQYSWALEVEKSYSLHQTLEETKQALDGDDTEDLKAMVHKLETATNNLPNLLNMLLGMRVRIMEIRDSDPVKGDELQERLSRIEQGLKNGDEDAYSELNVLAEELFASMPDEEARDAAGDLGHKIDKLLLKDLSE